MNSTRDLLAKLPRAVLLEVAIDLLGREYVSDLHDIIRRARQSELFARHAAAFADYERLREAADAHPVGTAAWIEIMQQSHAAAERSDRYWKRADALWPRRYEPRVEDSR